MDFAIFGKKNTQEFVEKNVCEEEFVEKMFVKMLVFG